MARPPRWAGMRRGGAEGSPAPGVPLHKETCLLPKPAARSSCCRVAAGSCPELRLCSGLAVPFGCVGADSTCLPGTGVPAGSSAEIWREG